MKTIYNTYVVMDSQEQCDRMKQLCIDNGLPIWDDEIAFKYIKTREHYFTFSEIGFAIFHGTDKTQITEQEFIELLKTTK